MAKNNRGRIRVFFAEFEGDSETIQEGLQAISVAVNKTFQSTPKTIKILSASENSAEENDALEEITSEDEEEVLNGAANSKSKRSSYKPPTMTIVRDLDLRPDGKSSWRDFYTEKKPATQGEIITLAVYYLKRILDLEKVTPDHVFTCFKDVKRRTPKDMPQSIRDIAKRKGWVDTSERGNIKITNHGENFVEHDLPAPQETNNS
jgi:hypothetical protein